MAVIVPDEGEVSALEAIRASRLLGGDLKLFKNDYTPVPGSTSASFTECDFSGYSAVISPPWSAVFTNASGRAETDSILSVFEHDGGATANDVYGWYYVGADLKVMMAERFADAPRVMVDLGDTCPVLPVYTTKSEN